MIQMGNGFILSVILVRRFGLASVGTYTIAAVAVSVLALLCGLGLPYSLPHERMSVGERNTVAACWALLMLPTALLIVMPFGRMMARHPGEWLEIALFAYGGYFFAQMNVLNVLLLLQQRARWAIVPPLVNVAGMVVGVLLGRSLVQFAFVLLIARAVGSVWLFASMKYEAVNLKKILRCGVSGLKYSPMDFISMLSEQTGPLIMASLLTRSELGVYGLCLQCLTSSDVPGWSVVQSYYPEMVRTRLANASAARSSLVKLSLLIAFLVVAGAAVLGRYIYMVPGFSLMMAVLAISVPSRYLNNFYDQTLRAAGYIRIGTCLAVIKFILSLAIFWMFASTLGLWGAIIGLALLSLVSSALYARKALPVMSIDK
jgi:O-antigen/teichoic acid export membrane protein